MLWIWNVPKDQCVKELVHILLHCWKLANPFRGGVEWGCFLPLDVYPLLFSPWSQLGIDIFSHHEVLPHHSGPNTRPSVFCPLPNWGPKAELSEDDWGHKDAVYLLSKDGVFQRTSYSPCSDGWHIWGEFWNSTIAIVMKCFPCLWRWSAGSQRGAPIYFHSCCLSYSLISFHQRAIIIKFWSNGWSHPHHHPNGCRWRRCQRQCNPAFLWFWLDSINSLTPCSCQCHGLLKCCAKAFLFYLF